MTTTTRRPRMRTIWAAALGVAGSTGIGIGSAQAHFFLQSPPAATTQDALGDPQKTSPCGPNGAGTPTGAVTTYQAGETITITIDERIYHPGHYRVALALNDPSELPAAPPVTPSGNDECASTVIDDAPTFPILADGMLQHSQMFTGPQSFDVTLPNDVTCDNCTLQVIEYMSSHAAPCFYYHCANIAIEDGSTTGSGGNAGTGGSTPSGSGGAPNDDGGPPLDPVNTESDSSCAYAGPSESSTAPLALLLLAGLARLRRARPKRA